MTTMLTPEDVSTAADAARSGHASGNATHSTSEDLEFGDIAIARLFLRQADINLLISILTCITVVVAAWQALPYRLELIWGAAVLAILGRQLWRRVGRTQPELTPERARRLFSSAKRQALIAGLLWGATAIAVPMMPPERQVVVILMALSLAIAANSTLSSIPVAALRFMLAIMIPYILMFLTRTTLAWTVLGVLGIAVVGVIVIGMRINAASLRTELMARRDTQRARRALTEAQVLWAEFSRSADAFALFDERGAILLWNDAYLALIGTDALTSGTAWTDISATGKTGLPEDDLLRGRRRAEPDFTHSFSRGGRWFRTTLNPLPNGHLTVTHTDITVLKENENVLLALRDDLVAARDKAEAANAAKTDFLAKMSHELRTPLNAVIGFADLMLQDHSQGRVDQDRHAGYARIVSDSGQHLLSIVTDLLDLARIEAGTLKLYEEEIDLAALTQEAQSMIGARTEADEDQTLRFEEDFPAEPIIVRGDRRLLRQAILNLLTNAVKFCPQDPLVILRVQRSKTGEVAVCIEDNGIGIPPEMRDAVQQPFVQAERAETRTYGGVGLGLALVRQFAEAHDGRMSIDAGEEGGTIACILLPAARIVSRAKPAAEPVPAG